MNYQEFKAKYEPKVKAGYDAGCYVTNFEGDNKLTDAMCEALDVSAKESLAYFDGTEFGAFAAFAEYLHEKYAVPAEDCEFIYMMALKMQFKHMSHGGDLTEVLNSVKKSSGLDLFDKPKEEWTANQKSFVMKLKHDEYYKAVLREIGLDTTPEEFWTKFANMFRIRYSDISARYMHMYSTLPAMIPNMTDAYIPVNENLSHLTSMIHRTLVWLVKTGEMTLEPQVITDATIREAIAENPVIQFGMHLANGKKSTIPDYETFKNQVGCSPILKKYFLGLSNEISDFVFSAEWNEARLLMSYNGRKENVDYILWPIYNTWLDMKAHGETPMQLCSKLDDAVTGAQLVEDKHLIRTAVDFNAI